MIWSVLVVIVSLLNDVMLEGRHAGSVEHRFHALLAAAATLGFFVDATRSSSRWRSASACCS
jgi:hypothetical protein